MFKFFGILLFYKILLFLREIMISRETDGILSLVMEDLITAIEADVANTEVIGRNTTASRGVVKVRKVN